MASSCDLVKQLTLDDVKKVIDALGHVADSTLCTHSLALIINGSGEATFTSSSVKLLNEAGIACPLGKFVSNAAKNYSSLCGEDCKYFLFILKEVFDYVCNRANKNDDMCSRKSIIKEIGSMKQILPCIFKSIRNISEGWENRAFSFSQNLSSVVLAFMLSKFPASVAQVLSGLITEFIHSICEADSLTSVLEYVVSHFDIFCCKIYSPLSESRVLKGFLFHAEHTRCHLNLENVNFIVVGDLEMKMATEKVAWVIKEDAFVSQLNPVKVYKSIFDSLKARGVVLILSSSTCDKSLKLMCDRNSIFLFDRLDKGEVEHVLSCLEICPLEDLNEILETKHIGIANEVKSISSNKTRFLHLVCSNSSSFLSAHHILLSAPFSAMWVECYSECLNCFKMILQWLSPNTHLCFPKKSINEVPVENQTKALQLSSNGEAELCCVCSKLKLVFESKNQNSYSYAVQSSGGGGTLLPPCVWELMFKTALERITEDSVPPRSVVVQATHLAVARSICRRMGVPFVAVKNFEHAWVDFVKQCNADEVRLLEPVVCKEIMISNVLDLIVQLLKIDSIVLKR